MITIEPPSTPSIPAAALSKSKYGSQRFLNRTCLGYFGLWIVCGAGVGLAQSTHSPQSLPKWKLSWSDEFNGANGSAPDPAKWSFETGEEATATTSRRPTPTDPSSRAKGWQPHHHRPKRRLHRRGRHPPPLHLRPHRTKGLFSQAYGRFEASIKLPLGKGIWPAFWLLGDNIGSAGWPKSGEIDILENIGEPSTMYSTLHGPGYSGAHGISAKFALASRPGRQYRRSTSTPWSGRRKTSNSSSMTSSSPSALRPIFRPEPRGSTTIRSSSF